MFWDETLLSDLVRIGITVSVFFFFLFHLPRLMFKSQDKVLEYVYLHDFMSDLSRFTVFKADVENVRCNV